MAYLTGVDASRDRDVRRAIFRLSRLVERLNCAVVCQRRLNKSGGGIGIVAAARTGLVVAADPNDAARRVWAATKCNLAAGRNDLGIGPQRQAREGINVIKRRRWRTLFH